jgi:thiamine kinase-like enzyme
VKFIDWEYAGVNDRYFDLACVCVEFSLDAQMQGLFLDFYFEDDGYVVEKLEAYKVIYKALCEEWFKS